MRYCPNYWDSHRIMKKKKKKKKKKKHIPSTCIQDKSDDAARALLTWSSYVSCTFTSCASISGASSSSISSETWHTNRRLYFVKTIKPSSGQNCHHKHTACSQGCQYAHNTQKWCFSLFLSLCFCINWWYVQCFEDGSVAEGFSHCSVNSE